MQSLLHVSEWLQFGVTITVGVFLICINTVLLSLENDMDIVYQICNCVFSIGLIFTYV